jgi:hypothetical protein
MIAASLDLYISIITTISNNTNLRYVYDLELYGEILLLYPSNLTIQLHG